MRRFLLVLTVAALMVVLLATSVTPAFAAWNPATGCREDDRSGGDFIVPESFPAASPGVDGKRTEDDVICMHRTLDKDDVFVFRFYDNRPPEV